MTQGHFRLLSDILEEDFKKKRARNSTYSLRAYARSLTLAPSTLLSLMDGKSGGSKAILKRISKRIPLSESDCEYLLKTGELIRTKNGRRRKLLRQQVLNLDSNFTVISDEIFQRLGYWYCFAVMELIKTSSAQSDPSWIAKRLKITKAQATDAIQALATAGIVEIGQDKEIRILRDFISLPSGPRLDLARNFHRHLMRKGEVALFDQPQEIRNVSSMVIRFRKSDLPQVDQFIKEFRRKFAATFEDGVGHDSVFALGIQFFRLDQDENQ